jgi:hypothetical protein
MKNFRIEIKWALIFILTSLAWMALEKALGWHDEKIADHSTLTNIFAIPAIAIYVFALLDKRKNYYHGRMTYKKGFLAGLVITLIVALFSPITQYIISTLITPDYFSNVIEYAVSSGAMTQPDAKAYFNLKSYMVQSVIGAAIMGIITSAVVALFTQTKTSS